MTNLEKAMQLGKELSGCPHDILPVRKRDFSKCIEMGCEACWNEEYTESEEKK